MQVVPIFNTQTLHYYSKKEGWEHMKETLDQNNPAKQTESCVSIFNVEGLRGLFSSVFAKYNILLFLMSRFCSSHAPLLGRFPVALAWLTSWSLQSNLGCVLSASQNVLLGFLDLSVSSCRDYPATHCLASVALLNCRGRFYNPLTHVSFKTLKPDPIDRAEAFGCQIGVNLDRPESHLITFEVSCIFFFFFRPFPFICWELSWVQSFPRSPLLLFRFRSGLSLPLLTSFSTSPSSLTLNWLFFSNSTLCISFCLTHSFSL